MDKMTAKILTEEIAEITMRLTDKKKVFYLLGVAEALLEIEAEEATQQPAS